MVIGKGLEWNSALAEGMQKSDLTYSGQHTFVETDFYRRVTHEVAPKDQALSCRDCHSALAEAPSCGRCHQPKERWDFETLASKGRTASQPTQAYQPRIDFRALGYADDPLRSGGRFTMLPLAVPAPQQAGEPEKQPAQKKGAK
jgi:hypothetical protein